MAASSHQSGEVAASAAAVTDVLDHLTVATHQVHSAIARRGLVGGAADARAIGAGCGHGQLCAAPCAPGSPSRAAPPRSRSNPSSAPAPRSPGPAHRGVADSPGYSTARSATR
jgi:hypothetical protein